MVITLVAGLLGGFCVALTEALPVWLMDLGWQEAPDNAAFAGALEAFRIAAVLPTLMCMFSSGVAFAQRTGVLEVPELEFQLALVREYLRDVLGFGRGSRQSDAPQQGTID